MSPKTPEQFQEIREKSKEHLVNVSMRLFAEKGYQNTSISMIAKEAGMAKGALYHYFKSKEELLLSVIQKGLSDIEKLFTEAAVKASTPREQLEALVYHTFESMQKDREFWALYASLLTQMHASDTMRKIFEPLVDGMFSMMIELFKSCNIPDAEERAYAIGAMMDGVGLHYLFVKKDYPIDKIADFIINSLLFPEGVT